MCKNNEYLNKIVKKNLSFIHELSNFSLLFALIKELVLIFQITFMYIFLCK